MTHTLFPVRQLALLHPLPAAELDRVRAAVPEVRLVSAEGPEGLRAAAGADAVLLGHQGASIDDVLGAAPGVRWIQTASAGVDRHLTPRLRASPVVLSNASGVHAPNIAEHVLALMLGFARGLPQLAQAQQRSEWRGEPPRGLFELEGQSLVVVGLGAIGAAIARKASALGLRVTGVRRDPSGERRAELARVVGLDALDGVLATADHVVIALPLTPATQGLFDAARLARVCAGAYLYNIGRGALVDTAALVDALQSGHLAGAGLDVVDPEPLPAASPLWQLRDRVVISGHTSGNSPRTVTRLVDLLIDNLLRARDGRPLRNVVDIARGY